MVYQLNVLVVGQVNGWFLRAVRKEAALQDICVDSARTSGDLVVTCDQEGIQATVKGKDLFSYDLIHLFTVQDNRSLWYAVAGEAAKRGVKIVDRNCYEARASEESLISRLSTQARLNVPFPKTIIVSSLEQTLELLKTVKKPVVLKTLNSRKGSGVSLIYSWLDILRFKSRRRNRSLAYREYIQASGDYRITVIGGKAYSAIFRRAQGKEWRNNLCLGGKGSRVELEEIPDLVKIAQDISVAFGFDIAGVDIIVSEDGKLYVLEVNRSPQLEASERITGVNLTKEVVNLYKRKCLKK